MKEMDDKEKKIELKLNTQLTTPWIDVLNLSKRNDNLLLLRFFTNLPEGQYEQSRLMTSDTHLRKFIDLICSVLDYYPIKSEKKSKQ